MCKGRFVTLGSGEMLTLAAIMPVFHQVEEVIEMKQEVLVEMITSATSARESQSIMQRSCRCAEMGGGQQKPLAQPRGQGPGKESLQKPGLRTTKMRPGSKKSYRALQEWI